MSSPRSIQVNESVTELKKMLKTAPRLVFPRIRMLIEIKKHENAGGISKRDLADAIGVNHNSIQTWRTAYIKGGIDVLVSYKKGEGRPTVFTIEEHEAIKLKLNNHNTELRGYIELLEWVNTTFKK